MATIELGNLIVQAMYGSLLGLYELSAQQLNGQYVERYGVPCVVPSLRRETAVIN